MADALTRFFSAWSETDAAKRRDLIAGAVADTGAYADPRSPDLITGIDALADYVGMFSANAPGWTARVVKSDTTAGMVRATVAFAGQGPDGTDMQQLGQYFCDSDGAGKIARLIGFVGTGAPE